MRGARFCQCRHCEKNIPVWAYWHRHTSVDNLQKRFTKHRHGDIKKSIRSLRKCNLIIIKPTGYGTHCSLNPKMIDKVERIIGISG